MDFKTRKRPTLRTVSSATGFAVTTVSRALRNDPEINIQTRKSIQSAASALGYQPDRAAQGLRMGRSLAIGLILDQGVGVAEFERRLISGVAKVIYGETPHSLVVLPQGENVAPLDPVRYLVDSARVDGLIFAPVTLLDERVRYLLDRNVPFVTLGRSDYPVAHAYVDFDTEAFVRGAVQQLARKGRTKLAMVPANPALSCANRMQTSFFESAQALGLEASLVPDLLLHHDPTRFEAAGERIAASTSAPDGIICGVETGAIALMYGLQRAGLAVGRDLDIVALSTSDTFDFIDPRIDSFHEDLFEAGKTLAQFLIQAIEGVPVERLRATGKPELRARV